jgi:hypothetical protein
MLYRYEGDNGILFQIKLENEAKFYLLIRLVIDDENHLALARKGKIVDIYACYIMVSHIFNYDCRNLFDTFLIIFVHRSNGQRVRSCN